MKKLLLCSILLALGGIPAWSQSTSTGTGATGTGTTTTTTGTTSGTTTTSTTPTQREDFLQNHPDLARRLEEHRQELLAKYAELPASEQQKFLQNHPQLQAFIKDHPQAVARAEANAAEAKPGVVDPNHPRVNEVNHREENQQQRIAQGDKAGTLNAAQTARLERQEKRIQGQETADMDQHGGHLTWREKHQLNKEENHESHEIAKDKHE